jgi:myo-inositol-1(or 4)-monophosphatase
MERTRFRNLGSTALQLAYVAKGSMAATIANTPKLWDIAGGAAIAEAAGALFTNWQGQKIFPVDLDSYDGQKFQVIVTNKKVHSEIVELLTH